jgi:hypothetical protein
MSLQAVLHHYGITTCGDTKSNAHPSATRLLVEPVVIASVGLIYITIVMCFELRNHLQLDYSNRMRWLPCDFESALYSSCSVIQHNDGLKKHMLSQAVIVLADAG